ncbi:D-aminoacid aminotransferase-like PLP-dependent enzyme [Hesseltinella vesiculosa]|uniref:D-aminoacid aminotransferase-like PLP-dependent enzyme n=1 Tax=Hesseltinella vesiculosa TaxID=101127 RepID=A0A1X2G4K4_9FUNG|nr:D-aminoacid aminotransferase-like PLP-dependent enzyme [Hesseltinella vesiculosa]
MTSIVVEQVNASEPSANAKYTIKETSLSFNDFICSYPRAAYTGMRTVNRKSIVELDAHMKRVVNSVSLMKFAEPGKEEETDHVAHQLESFRDRDAFEEKLIPLLRQSLSAFYEHQPQATEAKTVVLVTYDHQAQQPCFASHVTELHQPSEDRAKIQMVNKARTMPSVKDTQWVRDRLQLEKDKAHDVNEVILIDDQNQIYEGMSSNFMAVRRRRSDELDRSEYIIQCASLEHVLLGTVMKIIMGICGRDAIDIEWVFPTYQDARAGKWEGCFLASTSRLLLPVETIYTNDGSNAIEFPVSPFIRGLRSKVIQEIEHRSYRIL